MSLQHGVYKQRIYNLTDERRIDKINHRYEKTKHRVRSFRTDS